MIINDNIKKLCLTSGLTQKEFAKRIGSNGKSLWAYMNSDHMPNVQVLLNLSRMYNLTIDFLLNEKVKTDNKGNVLNATSDSKRKQIIRRQIEETLVEFADRLGTLVAKL